MKRPAERRKAQARIIAAVPRRARPGARRVLALADRYLPLRSVGKVAFLQTVDVARAASRRIGEHLVTLRMIEVVDDDFYLSSEELLTTSPGTSLAAVVAARRQRREEHLAVRLPSSWHGRPEVVAMSDDEDADDATTITGTGASPGVVTGRVRVMLDPDFEDVEAGEILVAPTTDPSWAAVMFTAEALVVDLGGS